MKKFFIICLIISFLVIGNVSATSFDDDFVIFQIFAERKVDIYSKSFKGWSRILKDSEKSKLYGLDNLSDNMKERLLSELKLLASDDKFGGKLK